MYIQDYPRRDLLLLLLLLYSLSVESLVLVIKIHARTHEDFRYLFEKTINNRKSRLRFNLPSLDFCAFSFCLKKCLLFFSSSSLIRDFYCLRFFSKQIIRLCSSRFFCCTKIFVSRIVTSLSSAV
jgi:hypothetical protein